MNVKWDMDMNINSLAIYFSRNSRNNFTISNASILSAGSYLQHCCIISTNNFSSGLDSHPPT